jgi:hypothetical protein
VYAAPQAGANEIAFMLNLKKRVEKLLTSKDKGIDKIISAFVDMKCDMEACYNMKFNLDECFNRISKELSNQGLQTPSKEFDSIKKLIKHNEKKYSKHLMGKDSQEETELPSLLVYGVTVSLCGMFLMCLPIPGCKDWGAKLVVAGMTATANSLCSENDKNKKKEK